MKDPKGDSFGSFSLQRIYKIHLDFFIKYGTIKVGAVHYIKRKEAFMPKPLAKFAPYFIHCYETPTFGFLVLSTKKISVFSKANARMYITLALREGDIHQDESLELLRQIEQSNMKEHMDVSACLVILGQSGKVEEVYGDCFSNSFYRPSRN